MCCKAECLATHQSLRCGMLATETFSIIDNHCNIKQKPPEVTHHDLSDRRYPYPHRHRQAQLQIFSRAEATDARQLHYRARRFRTALVGRHDIPIPRHVQSRSAAGIKNKAPSDPNPTGTSLPRRLERSAPFLYFTRKHQPIKVKLACYGKPPSYSEKFTG